MAEIPDILFETDENIFSYRVAGICIKNGKVLLQKQSNENGFAFPGGHVAFGETNEETLIREFKEEIEADISVGELKWVAEIFFRWNDKHCQQICNFYKVTLKDETQILMDSMFLGSEKIKGRDFEVEFHWIPLEEIEEIKVYPKNTFKLLSSLEKGVQHFIDRD